MEPKEFFVFTSSEDGISISGPFTKSELLKKLTPDSDNEGANYFSRTGFYSKVPEIDKGCFEERDGEEKMLVIRGTIVVPQAKSVIETFEIP